MSRADNLYSPRWPHSRDLVLMELWDAGKSASEIAHALRHDGVTRNAVVGRRRRLKLKGRPSPIIRRHELQGGQSI